MNTDIDLWSEIAGGIDSRLQRYSFKGIEETSKRDVPSSSCAQRDQRLDADCVENLLQSRNSDRLIVRLFVAAHYLFTYAQPPADFTFTDSLRNPHLPAQAPDLSPPF